MMILRNGSKGSEVGLLQKLLNQKLVPSPAMREDNDFGPGTEKVVKAFQQQAGLAVNGVVDQSTWGALGRAFSPVGLVDIPEGVEPEWMKAAAAEIGVKENPAPGQENPRIVEYHSATTLKATSDEIAWCSSFTNWVMRRVGIDGTHDAAAASWLQWGRPTQVRRGAVAVIFNRKSIGGAATGSTSGFHVAFVDSITQTHIRLLGGNQGDSVKLSNFPLSDYEVRGMRWPV
jgi:uncharacterized protein (TIGR02594 family)